MIIDGIRIIDDENEEELNRIAKRSKVYIDLYYEGKGHRVSDDWFDNYISYLYEIVHAIDAVTHAPLNNDETISESFSSNSRDERISFESYNEAKREIDELATIRHSEEKDTETVIKEFLSKHKDITGQFGPSFAQLLLNYMEERHLTDPELYHFALVDRRVFNSIINNKKKPSRNTVICLALALHLNMDDTNRLLKVAKHPQLEKGFSLPDTIIGYCIEDKIYNIHTVDWLLDHYDQKTLVNYDGYKMKYFVSASIGTAAQLELISSKIEATVKLNKLVLQNSACDDIHLDEAINLFKSGQKITVVFRSKDKAMEFYRYLKNNKCIAEKDF